jgi:hypothetical protein
MQFENKTPFRVKELAQSATSVEFIAAGARGPYEVGHGCSLLGGPLLEERIVRLSIVVLDECIESVAYSP